MPRKTLKPAWGLLILACLAIIVVGLNWGRGNQADIPWRTNFNAARQEAVAAHKPMLLDFSASWCGPCQEMKRTIWTDRKVADALNQYVPVAIDVDEHPDLQRQYQINGIPAMLIVNADSGKVIRSSEGLPDSTDGFIHWLNSKSTNTIPLP